MTQQKQITVQTERWMQQVSDRVDASLIAYQVGTVKDMPNTLAVSLAGSGATRFFCETHQRIYGLHETCPDCVSQSQM